MQTTSLMQPPPSCRRRFFKKFLYHKEVPVSVSLLACVQKFTEFSIYSVCLVNSAWHHRQQRVPWKYITPMSVHVVQNTHKKICHRRLMYANDFTEHFPIPFCVFYIRTRMPMNCRFIQWTKMRRQKKKMMTMKMTMKRMRKKNKSKNRNKNRNKKCVYVTHTHTCSPYLYVSAQVEVIDVESHQQRKRKIRGLDSILDVQATKTIQQYHKMVKLTNDNKCMKVCFHPNAHTHPSLSLSLSLEKELQEVHVKLQQSNDAKEALEVRVLHTFSHLIGSFIHTEDCRTTQVSRCTFSQATRSAYPSHKWYVWFSLLSGGICLFGLSMSMGYHFFLFHRMNCMQHVMNCRKHYMTRKLQTGSWKYSDGWMCILVVRWYHPTGVNRRSKNRAQGRLTWSTRGTFTNVLHIHSFDMCLSLTSVRKIDLVPKDVCVLKHQNLRDHRQLLFVLSIAIAEGISCSPLLKFLVYRNCFFGSPTQSMQFDTKCTCCWWVDTVVCITNKTLYVVWWFVCVFIQRSIDSVCMDDVLCPQSHN